MPQVRKCGFTLVEMLVVIGIIGVLAALLLPAIMRAVGTARNTVIALEVKQLETAIEAYRLEKGDYPPNFRDVDTVRRHIMKCYPRIDQTYFAAFMRLAFPTDTSTPPNPINPTPPSSSSAGTIHIDESECLVFWLSLTDTNPQYPFLAYYNPGGLAVNQKKYYDFDQTRLFPQPSAAVGDVQSFQAKYCGETYYIYADSRSYNRPYSEVWDICRFASDKTPSNGNFAYDDNTALQVRPYWSTKPSLNPITGTGTLAIRENLQPVNPTTFQIICAGQDGDFGYLSGDTDVKQFNSGINYSLGDNDNITNFSNGRTLKDNIP
jgi:type II secretion system protein G